jgi:uncharacterized protein
MRRKSVLKTVWLHARRITLKALLAALPVLLATPLSVHAANPSFDCDKAQTEDEHTICSDMHLAELDQAVSIAYRQAEEKSKDQAQAAARDALAARHLCGDDRLCILDQQVSAITNFSSNWGP